MNQAERILRLQELFTQQEFVNFDDLCRQFSASKSSIRRDLMELERRNVVRRVHGGAISLQTRDEVLDFNRLSSSAHDEKARIGAAEAGLVRAGKPFTLGGGPTAGKCA